MNMNKIKNTLLLGIGAMCVSSFASAAITLPSGLAKLEDDNIEYVIGADGEIKAPGDGQTLAVGDKLRAIFQLGAVRDGVTDTLVQDLTGSQELTGFSEIEIVSIVGNVITFGPSASFAADYGLAAGAMAAFWEQPVGDFDVDCASVLACETAATNGNHWLTVGFGDDDDYWLSLLANAAAGTNIDLVAGLNSGTTISSALFGLSILENNTGYELLQQDCSDVAIITSGVACSGTDSMVGLIGSGTVQGGLGLASPFFARSDFDFILNRVPEPTPLALLGLGLALIGFSRRRKIS